MVIKDDEIGSSIMVLVRPLSKVLQAIINFNPSYISIFSFVYSLFLMNKVEASYFDQFGGIINTTYWMNMYIDIRLGYFHSIKEMAKLYTQISKYIKYIREGNYRFIMDDLMCYFLTREVWDALQVDIVHQRLAREEYFKVMEDPHLSSIEKLAKWMNFCEMLNKKFMVDGKLEIVDETAPVIEEEIDLDKLFDDIMNREYEVIKGDVDYVVVKEEIEDIDLIVEDLYMDQVVEISFSIVDNEHEEVFQGPIIYEDFIINKYNDYTYKIIDYDSRPEWEIYIIIFLWAFMFGCLLSLIRYLISLNRQFQIRGGAKRRNNLNNRGTGGKSKIPRDPLPPDNVSSPINDPGRPVDQVANGGNKIKQVYKCSDDLFKQLESSFVKSSHPGTRTLVNKMEIDFDNTNFFSYDPQCSPFCGYGAIDIGVGRTPDIKNYRKYMISDDPLDIGDGPYLNKHALCQCCNLRIMSRMGGIWVELYSYDNNPNWKWVVLEFIPDEPGRMEGHFHVLCLKDKGIRVDVDFISQNELWEVFDPSMSVVPVLHEYYIKHNKIIHCYMLVGVYSAYVILNRVYFVRLIINICVLVLLISIICAYLHVICSLCGVKFHRFEIIEYVDSKDNKDRRINVDRLEDMLYHDKYVVLSEKLFGFDIRIWRISVVRFSNGLREAQKLLNMRKDPYQCMAMVNGLRTLNTNINYDVLFDTGELLRQYIELKYVMYRNISIRGGRLICYNHPGNLSVGKQTYDQLSDINDDIDVGEGPYNHIISFRVREVKINKPVAVAPSIMFGDHEGAISPGYIGVTDGATLLSAFVSRSMTVIPVVNKDLEKFVMFSKKFINFLIPYVDLDGIIEEDCLTFFQSHYHGLKSASYIRKVVDNTLRFRLGERVKDYEKHSCFVKFENNSKLSGNKAYMKPRLIMTMSERALVECCQVMKVLQRWKKGPFSKFQVKEMTSEEMAERICSISDMDHYVTDYESFECSVSQKMQELENHLVLKLMKLSGLVETRRKWIKHHFGGIKLETKYGKFYITTRRSGIFTTSDGNGLINGCLYAYQVFLKTGWNFEQLYSHIRMLVEGDDGFVKSCYVNFDVITSLGFRFSATQRGSMEGDCDFLRSRWISGKRFLNIGRCLSIMWVKKGCNLKLSKQLFIQRCMGNSLYHLSPGHPILTSIVNRIGYETRSVNSFKNYTNYLDRWVAKDYSPAPRYVRIDDSMRVEIAKGNKEFPGIPIWCQLELERRIEDISTPFIHIGDLLDEYLDVKLYKSTRDCLKEREYVPKNSDWFDMVMSLQRVKK